MTRIPPPDLRARILEQARREASPTRAEHGKRIALATAIGALTALALFARMGMASGRASAVLLCLGIGGGVVASMATWLAAARGPSMLGRSTMSLAAVAAVAPLAVLVSALAAAGMEGTLAMAGGTMHQHVTCFLVTVLFALGPLVAILYARRGTDPVHPHALGAAVGAAAGAWGGALIDLHCTLTSVEHLALAHVLPIALLGVVGAIAGGRLLGIRGRARS